MDNSLHTLDQKRDLEIEQKNYQSIHARQMCEFIWKDHREIDKWIDAVIINKEMLRVILGKQNFDAITDKLKISKPDLDSCTREFIENSEEFRYFLEKI
jgi:hypothetical protein